MDLANIFLDLVQNNGIFGAFTCLAFYFILQNVKNINKLRSLITKDNKKITPSSFRELVELNFFIKDLLKQTLEQIDASRAMLVMYHNGEHSIGGYSFTKMSCTQECISSKTNSRGQLISSCIRDFINIPISAFSLITRSLFDKGMFTLPNISKIKNSNLSTYEELKKHGARSARFFPLRDSKGHIFGFISFEFKKEISEVPSQTELTLEETCVNKVASILEMMTRGENGEIEKA